MNAPIQQLLSVADTYLAHTGRGISGLSAAIFNDGKVLNNLRNGADLLVGRHVMAMQWFSDNWPARKAWPKGVKRPTPTAKVA